MSQWRRYLPEGRHLLLLGGLAVIVLAAIGFASLYQIKAEALAERTKAAAQVKQLEDQKAQLEDTLARAHNGVNVEPDARQFFNYGRPGDKVIVPQAATSVAPLAPPVSPAPGRPPYWQQWLDRLLGRSGRS